MSSIPTGAHILLDTNVLVDMSKHSGEFTVLHDFLRKNKLVRLIDQTIQFEFLRNFRSKANAHKFLIGLFGPLSDVTLPVSDEIYENALEIARICHLVDNKDISFADALIGGQIMKYTRSKLDKNSVILASQNHRDFPPILFERVDELLVTLKDGSIRVVGFYIFNINGYNKATEALNVNHSA